MPRRPPGASAMPRLVGDQVNSRRAACLAAAVPRVVRAFGLGPALGIVPCEQRIPPWPLSILAARLFVFPAKPEALEEFVADLAERYRSDPHAASPEIFSLKQGTPPRVVGSFAR